VKAFVWGLILGVAAVVVGGYAYFASGRAPVATSDPMLPMEKTLARLALHARIEKDMPRTVPIKGDEGSYAAGAKIYRSNCAVCHGLPGQPDSNVSKGLFPYAPQLFKHGVTDDPAGETYWKVANGIRLTGMPGFRASLSETELWQVSIMLAEADKLPQSVKDTLAAPLTVQ
jgi:mono/diheme cytochrome c family protein